MRVRQFASVGLLLVVRRSAATLVGAQQPGVGQTPSSLPLTAPIRERGSSVTPAFEGWYFDKDGSQRVMVGYFNRNTKQEFDIPVGPEQPHRARSARSGTADPFQRRAGSGASSPSSCRRISAPRN